MAQLEDLIQDIVDPRLRAQIASEVGKLKARKKFDLVFEQHLPETSTFPNSTPSTADSAFGATMSHNRI